MISYRVTAVVAAADRVAVEKALTDQFHGSGPWFNATLNADGSSKAATHYWFSAMLPDAIAKSVLDTLSKTASVKAYASHPGGNTVAVGTVVTAKQIAGKQTTAEVLSAEKLKPTGSAVQVKEDK